MVQDNNFFPGIPSTLWPTRSKTKPAIIGTNKDEQAMGIYFADLGGNYNLTDYTRTFAVSHLSNSYKNFYQNQTMKSINLLENLYLKHGVDPNDHLAWVQFMVDVRIHFYLIDHLD
jgi:hypothetical protein